MVEFFSLAIYFTLMREPNPARVRRSGNLLSLSLPRCVLMMSAILFVNQGCPAPVPVHPPARGLRARQTDDMLRRVLALGKNGDWLVIRGYHKTDQLVAAATRTPLSHAAVLDMQNEQVIEAEGKGVHTTKLRAFIDKAHRLLLIRPIWAKNPGAGDKAVVIARKLVGMPYDFLGTVGLDHPHAYYCSELAVSVYKDFIKKKDKLPKVMEPGQMYLWGTILYDSRPRDTE